MANLMSMRFGTFEFPFNPAELKVAHRALLRESILPGGGEQVQRVGAYKRRVSGKGYFTGDAATEDYLRMESLFGTVQTLFMPGRERCIRDRDDNPGLSRAVRQCDRQMFTGVFYSRFIEGKWVAASGLIYPFAAALLCDAPPEGAERYAVSIDYGTVHPTSMGLWALNGGV